MSPDAQPENDVELARSLFPELTVPVVIGWTATGALPTAPAPPTYERPLLDG